MIHIHRPGVGAAGKIANAMAMSTASVMAMTTAITIAMTSANTMTTGNNMTVTTPNTMITANISAISSADNNKLLIYLTTFSKFHSKIKTHILFELPDGCSTIQLFLKPLVVVLVGFAFSVTDILTLYLNGFSCSFVSLNLDALLV